MNYLAKFFLLFTFLIISGNTTAADKFQGSGKLTLDEPDIKWFIKYLSPPAGHSPMVFFVLAENGKAIWSTYWYCPFGNCQTLSKKTASKKCVIDAEKYYKKTIFGDCKIFASKRTIVWKNDINPGRGKISKLSSKWDESEIRAKLTELGFIGGSNSLNDTKKKKKQTNESKTKNDSTEISNEKIKRLKELKKLLDEGILTQEEFNSEKSKILN